MIIKVNLKTKVIKYYLIFQYLKQLNNFETKNKIQKHLLRGFFYDNEI